MNKSVKTLLLGLAAALPLAGCYRAMPISEMGPEVDRKLLPATFEALDSCLSDTSLIKLGVPEPSLEMPEGVCLSELLYGEGVTTDNLFIEHRVIANEGGTRAVLMRGVPRFVLVNPLGDAACYPDFRGEPLPALKARKGRDLAVEAFKPICATHTGFITERYLALLTPALRCTDWDISGPWRFLDFYCLKDGRYLGSAEVPLADTGTQWIYDLELRSDTLLAHYTDMNQSSLYRYRFTLDFNETEPSEN